MSLARMHGGSTPQIVGGRQDLIGQANLIGASMMETVNDAYETAKAKLQEKTLGVPNYVFALAALGIGGYYLGKKRRWFK